MLKARRTTEKFQIIPNQNKASECFNKVSVSRTKSICCPFIPLRSTLISLCLVISNLFLADLPRRSQDDVTGGRHLQKEEADSSLNLHAVLKEKEGLSITKLGGLSQRSGGGGHLVKKEVDFSFKHSTCVQKHLLLWHKIRGLFPGSGAHPDRWTQTPVVQTPGSQTPVVQTLRTQTPVTQTPEIPWIHP